MVSNTTIRKVGATKFKEEHVPAVPAHLGPKRQWGADSATACSRGLCWGELSPNQSSARTGTSQCPDIATWNFRQNSSGIELLFKQSFVS